MTTARIPWRPFLRHRYRAHAQGWLCVAVGLLTGYYADLYAHEPLWVVLPVAFIAAFVVVAVMVAVAALLRFPWWFLAPLTAVSTAFEWALRRLLKHPWRRRPQPRECFLSDLFALWQRWRVRRLRNARRAGGRRMPLSRPHPASWPTPATSTVQATAGTPAWSADGLWDYMFEAIEAHFQFWFFGMPVAATGWLWLVDGQPFWLAALVSFVLWLLASLVGLVPLAAGVLALFSSLFAAAGLPPRSRWDYVHRRWAESALSSATTEAQITPIQPPPRPVRRSDWLVPLAIGLWIGNTWGKDE